MGLFSTSNWLKAPADRDVIARWTVGAEEAMRHDLAVPPPPDPERWEFLALGDTGDSETSGPGLSPQDAVAQQLAADAALPGREGSACLVLHMGDVVYMTGERRLYDRNFRRPYSDFLMPESTVDDLRFRLPFLPVPGNHDYYDLGGWARWLSRVPFLGAGLRAISHQIFAFSLPEGGSDMGRAYMRAFVDSRADTRTDPLPYRPGERTRLPNRYYRFQAGQVDFFALDSNTLDAPPGGRGSQVRAEAAERVTGLEARAAAVDRKLRRDQAALDQWRAEQRGRTAEDTARRGALTERAAAIASMLAGLKNLLTAVEPASEPREEALAAVETAARRWNEAAADLTEADDPAAGVEALEALEEASDEGCAALRALEGCLSVLPDAGVRPQLLGARSELENALDAWSEAINPAPKDLCDRLRGLSEEALDVQRELALERRRMRYRPEDHDAAQLAWLDTALAESVRDRPDAWRIVYMHHPLYTTIGNHCERPDVLAVRENLMGALADRVHLVLSGHSHAFEWFRSDALPHTGLFVTGGGGQVTLRRSVLEPRLLARNRDRYDALRTAGVTEYATGGTGPAGLDGEAGPLYHYLRIAVTPEALTVRPVGVRRLESGAFRREEPMPVNHAARLPESRPPWKPRRLEGVEVRRGRPPHALWETL